MAGPNSAPNGEAGLVKGYPLEDWMFVEYKYDGILLHKWVPMRDYLAQRKRLRTGKTK